MTTNLGYKDVPIDNLDKDTLEVKDYVEGLSDFIRDCDTPMTIAIQGDWGSGKTSIMNMIKGNIIKDNVVSIWFNTWQYSQFEMQSYLSVSLLSHFLAELEAGLAVTNFINKVGKGLMGVAKSAMVIPVEKVLGETVAGNLNEALASNPSDIGKEIVGLRNSIKEAIDKRLAKDGKERVVVFIDDLDRLPPEKAVELLEVLKIFMDVERCVFVLAVDYEVVVKGLKKKFGESVDDAKGKSFFDKIIQLPFGVPVSQYKIDNYVTNLLSKMRIEHTPDDIPPYVGLINSSIGFNPRSVKRLFNAFLLLNNVATRKNMFDEKNSPIAKKDKQRVLFAVLCLQMAFDAVYDYLLKNKDRIGSELMNDLSDKTLIDNKDEFMEIRKKIKDDLYYKRLEDFMAAFIEALQLNEDDELSDDEVDNLKNILSFSSITATSQEGATAVEAKSWQRSNLGNWESYSTFLKNERNISNENIEIIKTIHDDMKNKYCDDIDIVYAHAFLSFKNKNAKGRAKIIVTLTPRKKAFILGGLQKPLDMTLPANMAALSKSKGNGIEFKLRNWHDYSEETIQSLIRKNYEFTAQS